MTAGGEGDSSPRFHELVQSLAAAFDSLAGRSVILFGGKGGVGKTTLSSLAALHISRTRPVVLFSTDPASSLGDLFDAEPRPNLRIEPFDAEALWNEFLGKYLENFVELGDRGTYLDREEIRTLFELSIPGIDELMGWMRVAELADESDGALVIVDTAPTGHTLRLLSSSQHFIHFSEALEEMQQKHRALVSQFGRRGAGDPMDEFLRAFRADFERRSALLRDPVRTAFVPVFLAEPWVTAQTRRLATEVTAEGIDIPFAALNLARHDCDCAGCRRHLEAEANAEREVGLEVRRVPRACSPLGSSAALEAWLAGKDRRLDPASATAPAAAALVISEPVRLLFFCGKGGVGKTSSATSVALQLSERTPGGVTLLSVDPAHSVRDVFASEPPPAALSVETIDTKEKWQRLRTRMGDEIERAIRGLTSANVSISYDSEVMRELLQMAPPGADEIFAIMRISDLLADPSRRWIVIDTAPTGHFLRLLDLPRTAGEWVREMMRLLLRYRELVPAGNFGEELLEASKALRRLEAALGSEESAAVIVTRAEPIVIAETSRLAGELGRRGLAIAGTVVNALTPDSGCACERSLRAGELELVARMSGPAVPVDRKTPPPLTLEALRGLIPLE